MVRVVLLGLGVLAFVVSPATAAIGDWWIVPIHHRDGGGWIEYPGAGYNGTSAWGANTIDGVRRVYWELSEGQPGSESSGAVVPSTVELYTIEFFDPTAGGNGWQPIESQIRGVNGENYPYDDMIPWVGAWGTNHQWIGSEGHDPGGDWEPTGPGPHVPESADYNAGANGIYMWLTRGSWVYAKWDFSWAIDRSWSYLKFTQVTPEPGTLGLLSVAGLALLRRRKKAL